MESQRSVLEKVTNIALLVATVAASIWLVQRQLSVRASVASKESVFLKDWKTFIPIGNQFGPPNAAIQIVELADFECPACGEFHRTLNTLRKTYRDSISITFVNFPLGYHRFAMPAAIAAACAANQGRFEQMFDALYDHQDSLGLKSFHSFAHDAGVTDSVAFATCVGKSDTAQSIRDGLALGRTIKLTGTPTIVLNGWKLGSTPTPEMLESMIPRVLKGQSPTEN